MSPDEILRENRRRAQRAAEDVGAARLRPLLQRAAADLAARIQRAEGLRGAGSDSFTAVQARVVLRQVEDVLRALKPGMRDLVVDQAVSTSAREVAGTLDYLREAEKLFTGVARPLALNQAAIQDEVRSGAEASVLRRILSDPAHKGHRGVLDRYGESVVGSFEKSLQQRVLTAKPWAEVRDDLVKSSPFLQAAPAHWAERVVRTESMHASNFAALETMQAADAQLGGDMLKVLCATFDSRTAADSYAVHGQVRRVSEPFDTWQGAVQSPPARPNDRETVVPHRASWPLPATLKPRSDGEVAAAWAREGRKGSPPARPRMSTVDLALLAVKPAQRPAAPPPQPAPLATPKPAVQPAPPVVRAPRPLGVAEPAVREQRASDGTRTFTDERGAPVRTDALVDRALALLDASVGRAGVSLSALVQRGAPQVDTSEPYRAKVEALGGERALRDRGVRTTIAFDDLEHVTFGKTHLDDSRTASLLAKLPRTAPAVVKQGGRYFALDPEHLLAKRLHREASGGPLGHAEVRLLDLDKLDPPAPRPVEPWARDAADHADRWLAGDREAGGKVRDFVREQLGRLGVVTRDDDVRRGAGIKFGADRAEAALHAVPQATFSPGANGLHDWHGQTFLRKEDVADSLPVAFRAISDQATFRAQPLRVRQDVMAVLRVLVHEELHGASAADASAYSGAGVGIEEAATEVLARKVVRELCGYAEASGPDVPLSLPYRHQSGNYVARAGNGGSYEKFIRRTLQAVGDALGHDGVHSRVEDAFAKTRQDHPDRWTTGARQVEAFVDALGVTGSAKAALRARLAQDLL